MKILTTKEFEFNWIESDGIVTKYKIENNSCTGKPLPLTDEELNQVKKLIEDYRIKRQKELELNYKVK